MDHSQGNGWTQATLAGIGWGVTLIGWAIKEAWNRPRQKHLDMVDEQHKLIEELREARKLDREEINSMSERIFSVEDRITVCEDDRRALRGDLERSEELRITSQRDVERLVSKMESMMAEAERNRQSATLYQATDKPKDS